MKHLLVTNDFPPKIGGIQTYLWELWRRLPPDDVVVLTTQHPGSSAWDCQQLFPVHRWDRPIMWPTPALARRVERLADQYRVDLVLFDPIVPVGMLALRTDRPYGVVVHGAELVFPSASPVYQLAPRQILRGARVVVAAGGYPAAGARRAAGRDVPTVEVPPGVDATRFTPLDADARRAARQRFGLDLDAPVLLSVSRLVHRKGMDVLLHAATRLAERHEGLQLVIAGDGRDRPRLDRIATELRAPVRFLGAVPDDDLPSLYGCADVFTMLCRDRWGGLEQEGFGIVFLEAAACGVPQVAGHSGGSHEAVSHGETGLVVENPTDVEEVVDALDDLLGDADRRRHLGAASRRRALDRFDHDRLAEVLRVGLAAVDVGASAHPHRPGHG